MGLAIHPNPVDSRLSRVKGRPHGPYIPYQGYRVYTAADKVTCFKGNGRGFNGVIDRLNERRPPLSFNKAEGAAPHVSHLPVTPIVYLKKSRRINTRWDSPPQI
jgi:hypothetical protein